MGKTTSVVISEELDRSLDQLERETAKRADVDSLTRSDLMRRLLRAGLEETDLGDLLAEERRIALMREQFVEEEAKVNNWRTGFETRVKDKFKARFENGYQPEQLDRFAENMIREAEIIWPDAEWAEEDYTERREEAIEYVHAVREEAMKAAEQSDWDPLDPERIFDGYEGVERGGSREDVDFDALVDDAKDSLRGGIGDHDALATMLSNTQDVPQSLAEEAVDAAADALEDDRADDADQDDRAERSTPAPSGDADDVDGAGMIGGEAAEMPDHSEPDPEEIDPDPDLVAEAREYGDGDTSWNVIADLLASGDTTEAEAVAAVREAKATPDQGGAAADD